MADPQLSADVTWSDPLVGQLHNPLSHHIGQWSSVHKHTAQLIHTTVACKTELMLKKNRIMHRFGILKIRHHTKRINCSPNNY